MENSVPLSVYAEDVNYYQEELNQEPAKLSRQSIVDERMLIGALFYEQNDPVISVREILLKMRKEWFRVPIHQAIFEAMGYQADKTLSATAISLYSQVKSAYSKQSDGILDDVIAEDIKQMQTLWLKKIKRLTEQEKQGFLLSLIDVVHDRFKQYSLTVFAKTLTQTLKADKTEKEKLNEIKRTISQIDESFRFMQSGLSSVQSVAEHILAQAVERSESGNTSRIAGYASGYGEFDEQISGFCNGRYHIIAARPSMGKTTFALNLMCNMARNGQQVVFFSYEMSKEQIVNKFLGMMTRINPNRIKLGDLSADEWIKLSDAVKEIGQLHIQIFDAKELGTSDVSVMVEICQRLHKQGELDVVFIDYIQLMSDASLKKVDPVLSISNISMAIQKTTRHLDIPIIALAQLSRNIEQRQDKKPRNSDLKGSGSLEQDADVIVFLHREEYYEGADERSRLCNTTSFIFTKNREGEKDAVVSLEMQPAIGLFSNLSPVNMLPSKMSDE